MTKRLGIFLGLGFVGVVLLLTGLAWDAVAHANDPSLAGREGIFTLRNPGHVLLGLGIGLVLVSLIGGCDTLLASAGDGVFARPGVRQAFLAVSTVVVVTAAGVTSWAAKAGHDHPGAGHVPGTSAAAGHSHGETAGPRAAGVDGSHGHGPAGGAELAAPSGEPEAHDHRAAAESVAARTGAAEGHTHSVGAAALTGHDHSSAGTMEGPAPSHHSHGPTSAGRHDPPSGHDHRGTAPSTQPSAPEAPRGTWGEIRVGPFVIPPENAGGGADHANIAVPSIGKPCSDCFLEQLEPDVVYADGASANLDTGVMLHHAVLVAAGRQDATCGPDERFPVKFAERFFASGNERTDVVFPPGFGYYVDQGNWSGVFHIMNHSASAKTVFFRVRVRWSPASGGGIRPLRPIWLDMNNCRTSEYAVPAGPSSSHWTWTSNLTGRIVATAGHVHDGGIRTTLTNLSTGQHVCTSWAGWGRNPAFQGSIESMSGCTWDRVGTVKKGEVLDLESVYNSPRSVPDAMGIMMAFVYETTDLGGGTPAPPDARGESPPAVASTPPPSSHDHH